METINKNKRVAVIGAGKWGKNLVRIFFEIGVLRAVVDSLEDNISFVKKKL